MLKKVQPLIMLLLVLVFGYKELSALKAFSGMETCSIEDAKADSGETEKETDGDEQDEKNLLSLTAGCFQTEVFRALDTKYSEFSLRQFTTPYFEICLPPPEKFFS